MEVQVIISAFLLLGGILAYFRPQNISTLNGYSEEKLRNVDLQKVRRTAGGGMVLLAALLGGGSWALSKAGVDETTLTVVGIILVFVGVITIIAKVETYNHNK